MQNPDCRTVLVKTPSAMYEVVCVQSLSWLIRCMDVSYTCVRISQYTEPEMGLHALMKRERVISLKCEIELEKEFTYCIMQLRRHVIM